MNRLSWSLQLLQRSLQPLRISQLRCEFCWKEFLVYLDKCQINQCNDIWARQFAEKLLNRRINQELYNELPDLSFLFRWPIFSVRLSGTGQCARFRNCELVTGGKNLFAFFRLPLMWSSALRWLAGSSLGSA